MADIKVNFSDEEAASEARTWEPIPSGNYPVFIVKIEEKVVKEFAEDGSPNKNAGKPWWNMQLKVNGGEYDKRVVFCSVMLFGGAGYTLAQLLKAVGIAVPAGKEVKLPPADTFLGKEITAVVVRKRDRYQERQQGSATAMFKNEVTGLKALESATTASGEPSLLP